MKSTTYLKNLKITPKKLRFYLKAVKKMSPVESLRFLYYGKQKATSVLYKSIESAISNAKLALKVSPDLLTFKLLTVEEGQKLKRYLPGSRGNVKPIKRRMSHIKIILEARDVKLAPSKIEVSKELPVKNLKSQNSNVKSDTKTKEKEKLEVEKIKK